MGLVLPCTTTRSAATIFELPEVIDHMPPHATDRIAGVPSTSNQRFAGRGLGEHGCDLISHRFERARVGHREPLVPYPDLARIRPFGCDDVTPDLVSVATSPTRTFAQCCQRGRDHLFEQVPRCTQERYIALRTRRIDGSGFGSSQSRRD